MRKGNRHLERQDRGDAPMKYSKSEITKAPNGESFVYNNGDYVCSTLDKEVAKKIIDALGKQFPQKPFKHEHYKTAECLCGKALERENYCPKCGQKIDWF